MALPKPKVRDIPIWPAVVVVYATMLPLEANIALGGLEFYAYRIGLFLAFPWILGKLMRGAIRLVWPDTLMIFAAVWMVLSRWVNDDFSTAIESGGVLGFDLLAAYFLARITIRSPDALRRLLVAILPGLLIVAGSLAVESITGRIIVRPFFSQIFGGLNLAAGGGEIRYEERLGLRRAYGPFPHPILAGLQMSSFLTLYAFAGLNKKQRHAGILVGASAFFALSSAAIVGLVLNILLIGYERLQSRIRGIDWKTLIYSALIFVTAIQLVSKNGILVVVVRYLTLDPTTGLYRLLIWEYAGAEVLNSPLFGIGFRGFLRPDWMTSDSIDAHWLFIALRFGLPCAIAIGLATFLALVMLGSEASRADRRDRGFFLGVAISLFVIGMLLFTVTLWGPSLAWFTFLLGAAVGAARGTTIGARISQ
jgi:hypothetical protein